jgi:ligand-binding SRPBCC domain-containing protein
VKLYFETSLQADWAKIKEGFDKNLFLSLSPPGVKIKLQRFDGCQKGDEIHLEILSPFGKQNWVSLITDASITENSWQFVDEGKELPWPLRKWKHQHLVLSTGKNTAKIIDAIDFSTNYFFLDWLIWPFLWFVFSIRPARYKKHFEE